MVEQSVERNFVVFDRVVDVIYSIHKYDNVGQQFQCAEHLPINFGFNLWVEKEVKSTVLLQ